MNKKDVEATLSRWRDSAAKRKEEHIDLVVAVLEYKGFTIRRGKSGHYIALHPKLNGGAFGVRALTISAHAHGKPGWVPKSAINQIIEALEVLEEND